MKKAILSIIVLVCCLAAFAGNFTIGVEQGVMTTTCRFGYDFGRWCEIGGGAGVPVVFGVVNTIDNIVSEPETDPDTGEEIPKDPLYKAAVEMFTLPRAELYLHFKAVDSEHFDLRLGAYAWAHASIDSLTSASLLVFAGPSLEISWKFNENLRLYLNGVYPLWGKAGSAGDVNGWEMIGMAFMGILDVAHVGLSWSL